MGSFAVYEVWQYYYFIRVKTTVVEERFLKWGGTSAHQKLWRSFSLNYLLT